MTKANKKFQSPLAKARGLGSTHEGFHHWMQQRITAVALIPLVAWLVYSILEQRGKSYWEFTQWLSNPVNAGLAVLLIATMAYHASLGLQVVIEDYISCKCKKVAAIIAVKLGYIALAVISIFSILKIAL